MYPKLKTWDMDQNSRSEQQQRQVSKSTLERLKGLKKKLSDLKGEQLGNPGKIPAKNFEQLKS